MQTFWWRCVVALAVLSVLVIAVDLEEDSDIEYVTPQLKSPGTPSRARPSESDVVSGLEEDDDLGEIGAEPVEETATKNTQVPRRMVRRWEEQSHFLVEAAFVTVLMLMGWRYFAGKTANAKLAHNWLQHNLALLSEQFALVGDSGNFDETSQPVIVRETPSNMVLYCSGRKNCSSALFRLELADRQDLLSSVVNFVVKSKDTLTVTFELEQRDMPTGFCCAVVPSRSQKEYKESCPDLSAFTSAKSSGYKGLPKSAVLLCDSDAAALEVLPPAVREALNSSLFRSLHITDASPFNDTKQPRVARFVFVLPKELSQLDTLMAAMLHVVDLIPTVRVSEKEGRLLKQVRSAVTAQLDKEKARERDEEIQRKRLEKKRKEQEELESRLESLPVDQRRKLEQKIARQQQKKAQNKGKGKMQFLSM